MKGVESTPAAPVTFVEMGAVRSTKNLWLHALALTLNNNNAPA
jgi:hypothetical protein